MADGRFAPTPSGPLHLGNLRTALLAWLFARSAGSRFWVRVEDLDPLLAGSPLAARQLDDLAALGLDWDGPPILQSQRRSRYDDAIDRLFAAGLTYPCFCSRREIREATVAPHSAAHPEGAYPGTCRSLTASDQRRRAAGGRRPALRLRADTEAVTVNDRLAGPVTAVVDDVVLRRGDGTPAYNLAVVVDDADQGVQEVVRGDDLLLSTPRQVYLARLLGLPVPGYAHVPMVLGPDGQRLAKRHGAVTLADRAAGGESPAAVRTLLAASLGLAGPGEPVSPPVLVDRFRPDRLPRRPWLWSASEEGSADGAEVDDVPLAAPRDERRDRH